MQICSKGLLQRLGIAFWLILLSPTEQSPAIILK